MKLREIDVSPLGKVVTIGTGFLSDCPSLRQVTRLDTLNNAAIQKDCLARCRSLDLSQQDVDALSRDLRSALQEHFRPTAPIPDSPGFLDARNHQSDTDISDDYDAQRSRAHQYADPKSDNNDDNDNDIDDEDDDEYEEYTTYNVHGGY